jgi:hypothetical protein
MSTENEGPESLILNAFEHSVILGHVSTCACALMRSCRLGALTLRKAHQGAGKTYCAPALSDDTA